MRQGKSKSLGGTGKFAPKLTFEERCGFYYALVKNEPQEIVVLASGLHRGTITRLANRKYKAYAGIRQMFCDIGEDAFRELYYTQAIIDRLAAARAQAAAAPPGPGV